jgi:glycosyltransferase involved in cell wall biosynthesis
MKKKLLILETHPIQYRAPIFQAYERLFPGEIEVVYASDFSVRGYTDKDFGSAFAWDSGLLSGYPYRILQNAVGPGIERWNGITGAGVPDLIYRTRPDAVLLHSLGYAFNWSAYFTAWRLGIPVWLRVETQDEAMERGPGKAFLRALAFRSLYMGLNRAFYIGELNRAHLLRHGLHPDRLTPARYCTPDPIARLSGSQKGTLRQQTRATLGLPLDALVVAFFGKLIPKKNPDILIDALGRIPKRDGHPIACLFVGSGEMEAVLRRDASSLEQRVGIRTVFAGFINQSALSAYYLASDIVVLPSRRMGETWGLVVNEALQAGCGVVTSDAVGCARDFASWERFRIFPVGDSQRLAKAIDELRGFWRDADWARAALRDYSVEASARAIHDCLSALPTRHGTQQNAAATTG